ncbi:MAG: hypothetical protein C0507_20715 [Cyanobacteria bacterium PR.3.49]|nr:hypothetical protein [Cyanobacteria bacterium PR.3.49]
MSPNWQSISAKMCQELRRSALLSTISLTLVLTNLRISEHTQLLQLKRLIKAAAGDSSKSDQKPLDTAFLSTIVCLTALNVLARNGCLQHLQELFSVVSTPEPFDIFSLEPDQLSALATALFQRATKLAPATVRNAMPAPLSITKKQCTAFRNFLQATNTFPLFAKESAIAHAYQLCAQSRRKIALKQVQSSNKEIAAETLISFTQLYTPGWVVETLIENTIPERCQKEFNVIDPACGGGNFLLPAFDHLLQSFTNEGLSEREAVELIADGLLCGVDLDPHAVWITHMALTVRCLRLEAPREIQFKGIQLLSPAEKDNLLGSLDRSYDSQPDHPLGKRYNAVLTNPPYIGRKLLSRELKQLLKTHYAEDSHDISVAFTRRCLELLKDNGRLGLITQSSILYLPSSRPFRETLINSHRPELVIEAGTGIFPLQSGEKIDSVIMVIGQKAEKQKSGNPRDENQKYEIGNQENENCLFINLRAEDDKPLALGRALREPGRFSNAYLRSLSAFRRFPNCQFNYSCPQAALTLFEKLPKLEEFADVRQGLATTNNARFVRFIWEVPKQDLCKIWFPYVKGAGSKRWYSPILNVVNWENDGAEIKTAVSEAYPYLKGKVHWVVKNEKHYFREGLSFSFVNSQNFAARLMPSGCIFDVAASALFPLKINRLTLLAFLNSSYAGKMAHLINPTINFQVGDVKRLPFIPFSEDECDELAKLAAICIEASKTLMSERDFHIALVLDNTNDLPMLENILSKRNSSVEAAFQEHCTSVKENDRLLESTETQIDKFVLSTLETKRILSPGEYDEIEKWLLTASGRARTEPLSEREYAERSLFRLALIPSSQQNKLSAPDIEWLEEALQSTIPKWIEERFAEFQRQQFSAVCIDNSNLLRNFPALSQSRS